MVETDDRLMRRRGVALQRDQRARIDRETPLRRLRFRIVKLDRSQHGLGFAVERADKGAATLARIRALAVSVNIG
jgi:hypothetical protein